MPRRSRAAYKGNTTTSPNDKDSLHQSLKLKKSPEIIILNGFFHVVQFVGISPKIHVFSCLAKCVKCICRVGEMWYVGGECLILNTLTCEPLGTMWRDRVDHYKPGDPNSTSITGISWEINISSRFLTCFHLFGWGGKWWNLHFLTVEECGRLNK